MHIVSEDIMEATIDQSLKNPVLIFVNQRVSSLI